MPPRRAEREDGWARLADAPDDAAVPASRDVAPRPGIPFLDIPRGKDLFVLDYDPAHTVMAGLVRPDAGEDVGHGVDDVAIAIIGYGPMRPLRRHPDQGYARINQEI